MKHPHVYLLLLLHWVLLTKTSTSVDTWAVKLTSTDNQHTIRLADTVAKETGLKNNGRIEPFQNVYKFTSTNTRSKRDISDILRAHPSITWSSKQAILKRTKRSMSFNDPKFSHQWHLHNTREVEHDVNVSEVWLRGVTGKGVVIAVVDDGLEHSNPDIINNYEPRGSYDFNDGDNDPSPRVHKKLDNYHGTRCAGLIAGSANNSVCGVGVAYDARVAGIRMLDGTVTDIIEAQSFVYKAHVNHVYSCSWGPEDNGEIIEGPGELANEALYHGTLNGRNGYGNVYVFASGNGGLKNDNCNFDGYANSIYTFTVGAVDEANRMPYYAEPCATMLAVTYSNGRKRDIVTTDGVDNGGCTEGFTGTSAAAPIAAGMIALMLEIRPCLSWRDVQALAVYTAVKVDAQGAVWVTNSAGLTHSDQHGFGLMDSYRLVTSAAVWPLLPAMVIATVEGSKGIALTTEPLVQNVTVLASDLPDDLVTLEYVAVTIVMSHVCRGSLEMILTSPTATLSTFITPRPHDHSKDGFDWTVTSARFWGEGPLGIWSLNITDHTEKCPRRVRKGGVVKSWTLIFYGSSETPEDVANRQKLVKLAVANGSMTSLYPCPLVNHTHEDIVIQDHTHNSLTTIEKVAVTVVAVVVSVLCLHLALDYLYQKVKGQCRQRSSTAVLYVNRGNKESEECALLSSDNEHDTLIFLNDQLIRDNGNSNNSAAVVSLDAETSQSDVPIIVSNERTDQLDAIVSLDAETSQTNASVVGDERTDQSDEDNDSDHGNETSALLQS